MIQIPYEVFTQHPVKDLERLNMLDALTPFSALLCEPSKINLCWLLHKSQFLLILEILLRSTWPKLSLFPALTHEHRPAQCSA